MYPSFPSFCLSISLSRPDFVLYLNLPFITLRLSIQFEDKTKHQHDGIMEQ